MTNDVWRVCIVGEEDPLTTRLVELLLEHTDVHIVLASPRPVKLFRQRVSSTYVSLASPDTLVSVLRGTNLVINALPPSPQARMLVFRAALEAGVSAMDVIQDLPSLQELQGHRDEFDDKYLLFVPGAGFSPGLTSALAMSLASSLEEVQELEISLVLRRADVHETRDYRKMAQAMATPVRIYADGRLQEVAKPDERELSLPLPIGVVSARLTSHDELYMLPDVLPRTTIRVRGALEGTLGRGYSILMDRLAALTEGHEGALRFLDRLDMLGNRVSHHQKSAIRVEAVGTKRGVRVRTAYTVVDSLTSMNAAMGASVAMAILTMRAMGSGLTWISGGFAPDVLLHSITRFGIRYIYEEEVLDQVQGKKAPKKDQKGPKSSKSS